MTSKARNIEKYLKNKNELNKSRARAENKLKLSNNRGDLDREDLEKPIKFKLTKQEKKMRPHIIEAADKYLLSPGLLMAIIKAESDFMPRAVSSQGAKGLMQLMDITAREMLVENVFEPRENIFAGAEYFSRLLKRYGHTIDLALAAYNAGPSNVEKYKGIPPFKETKRYIQKVKKYWRYYRNFR